MKKSHLLILFLSLLFLSSCEEVVQLDLPTAAPRIVIEASINWQKGTTGNFQKIKLTTTTGFYNTVIPTVSGATVIVKNSSNVNFIFTELTGTGEYVCTNFVPKLN